MTIETRPEDLLQADLQYEEACEGVKPSLVELRTRLLKIEQEREDVLEEIRVYHLDHLLNTRHSYVEFLCLDSSFLRKIV